MKFSCIPALATLLLFAACGKKEHAHGPGERHNPAESGQKPEGHGSMTKLGTIQLGDLAVDVAQEGKLEAGKQVGVELSFAKGKPLPSTVRAWVGIESGAGSLKAKLSKEGDGLHDHLEVPKPLPEGSKLWFEAETATGTVRASIAFRQ